MSFRLVTMESNNDADRWQTTSVVLHRDDSCLTSISFLLDAFLPRRAPASFRPVTASRCVRRKETAGTAWCLLCLQATSSYWSRLSSSLTRSVALQLQDNAVISESFRTSIQYITPTSAFDMRYQHWDVLLFPDSSRVPVQEFDTKCHLLHDQSKCTLQDRP